MQIVGAIERISPGVPPMTKTGLKRLVVTVGGVDYSALNNPGAVGEVVSFEVEQNGQYLNAKNFKKTTGPGIHSGVFNLSSDAVAPSSGYAGNLVSFPSGAETVGERQKSIVRQSSLRSAAQLIAGCFGGGGLTVDEAARDAIRIAEVFVRYVETGDVTPF